MRSDVATLLLTLVFLAAIAINVPWTRSALATWLATAFLLIFWPSVFTSGLLRFAMEPLLVAWGLVIFFPQWSPFAPLSPAERNCQEVIREVSAGARVAYEGHTLSDQLATFIAQIEDLEPPNEWWDTVRTAQLLDLRCEPPQVGVGDATERLVSYPWQAALDHRVARVRVLLEEALRSRRLRQNPRPSMDDMTVEMRYDHFFLSILDRRLDALRDGPGGLAARSDEAAALLELGREVSAPTSGWARLRDLVVEIQGYELKNATSGVNGDEIERATTAASEARTQWADLRQREPKTLATAK